MAQRCQKPGQRSEQSFARLSARIEIYLKESIESIAVLHTPAYLLVYHGSSDPRPQAAMDVLVQSFCQRIRHAQSNAWIPTREAMPGLAIGNPGPTVVPGADSIEPWVGSACLEAGPYPLHKQLEQVCKDLQASATESKASSLRLVVLPVFLLPGVHVMDDVPAEIALAQQAVGTAVSIETRPYLGSHPGLQRLLAERMSAISSEAWVLLAHGSRRSNANRSIAALADHVGAVVAYWSGSPSLESCLQELIQSGLRKIAILPYFLFAGGITDAIGQTVATLAQRFPTLDLHLSAPLDAGPELADLLVDLAINRVQRAGVRR